MEKIGLLAGAGQFPLLLARSGRDKGAALVAVAHEGETEPELENLVDDIIWVKIGQVQRSMDFLAQSDVRQAIMAGGISKKNMFSSFQPDERALALAARLPHLSDDTFLRGLAEEYEKEGIVIRPATYLAPELLAPAGQLSARPLTPEEEADARFGWTIAKRLGELDVGQLVVVRNRAALALEAIDGSDETIRRGGRLGRENAVVVKVVKPSQDYRFDLPSVGLGTLETMVEVKASALVVEAEAALIFDREAMMAAADAAGIAVAAWTSDHA
jgi:hypothetical protein